MSSALARHWRFVDRMSHRLALKLFLSAARYQTRLAYRQQLLGRLVDIGAELFAMAAACARAHAMTRLQPSEQSPVMLADLFCRQSQRRVRQLWRALQDHDDGKLYRVAQDVLAEKVLWLEDGIV